MDKEIQEVGVHGEIAKTREKSRIKIAMMLIWSLMISIGICLLAGTILLCILPADKFSFQDMLTLVSVIGSIFSGLVGCAVTFYFSSKE